MAEPSGPADREPASEDAQAQQVIRYAEDLRRLRQARRALGGRIQSGPQGRFTILIVDDEKAIRTLVAATLGADRYEVLEATRGTEAVTLARAKQPALIILDWHMADLDGVEVCKLIRADPSIQGVPIVMVTSARDPDDRKAALEAGATRYLTKPFSPAELLDIVEQLLLQS